MTEIQSRWRRISARAEGLVRAAQVFLQALRIQSEDPYQIASKVFLAGGVELLTEISDFRARHETVLPPAAIAAIDRFLRPEGLSRYLKVTDFNGVEIIKATLPILESFCSEISFLLDDQDATGSRLTERAFGHLQRSIAIIPAERKLWLAAFSTSEADCEKLGGLHLLRFGIYAFKAGAGGARTDLIMGDVPSPDTPLAVTADALVLTEWKKIPEDGNPKAIAETARRQLELYSQGALMGIEVRATRYAVLVSKTKIELPPDVQRGDVVYRHINIAVNPLTPSAAAKK